MNFSTAPLKKPMPVPVLAISDITNALGVTRVVIDNYDIVLAGIRHLKELGHTRIAFFKGPEHNGDTEARWAAVLRVTAESGVAGRKALTATTGKYFEARKLSMMERGSHAAMQSMKGTNALPGWLGINDADGIET